MSPDIVTSTLRVVRRRWLIAGFFNTWARASLFFYGILVALTAAAWWLGEFRPNLPGLPFALAWPLILAALAALLITLLRIPSLLDTASIADRLGKTQDRFITALRLARLERPNTLEDLALKETTRHIAEHKSEFCKLIRLRPPAEARWLIVPLVTLYLFWWDGLKETAARELRRASANAEIASTATKLLTLAEQLTRRAPSDEKTTQLAQRLKQAAEHLRAEAEDGGDARKAALRELATLDALVRELRRPDYATREELQSFASALQQHEATRPAAEALKSGDNAKASQQLREASKGPSAEQAARSIEKAMEHLAQNRERISRQLEELRKRAEELGSERSQLLQQLADMLNELQQQQSRNAASQHGEKNTSVGQGGGQQPMSDRDLKRLLAAIEQMKEQQQGGDGISQPQQGNGDGTPSESSIAMFDFNESSKLNADGESIPIPSGHPGGDKDDGTNEQPFGKAGAEKQQSELTSRLPANLGEGETLSILLPTAASGDAKATRRYQELTEAAAAAAQDAVLQENMPVSTRHLIRRYFEAIRSPQGR